MLLFVIHHHDNRATWIHGFCQVPLPQGSQAGVREHLYVDVVVGVGVETDHHPRVPLPVEADGLVVLIFFGIVRFLGPQIVQDLHGKRCLVKKPAFINEINYF